MTIYNQANLCYNLCRFRSNKPAFSSLVPWQSPLLSSATGPSACWSRTGVLPPDSGGISSWRWSPWPFCHTLFSASPTPAWSSSGQCCIAESPKKKPIQYSSLKLLYLFLYKPDNSTTHCLSCRAKCVCSLHLVEGLSLVGVWFLHGAHFVLELLKFFLKIFFFHTGL